MDYSHISIPNLNQQSPAVDFIENDLEDCHPAFSQPPSRFDPSLRRFVILNPPTDTLSQPSPDHIAAGTSVDVPSLGSLDSLSISPRPGPRPVEALELWDSLFPQAMDQVVRLHPQEPDHLMKSGQRIRDKTDWTQVFDQVQKAQNEYFKQDNKFSAGVRKVYRKFGDHVADPLNRMTKLVPGGGDLGAVAVTPIIGCVQILLEAARAASSVRKNVTDAFDRVERMFSDIELFLHIYPEDENIKKASIDLIASTLFAAENVLGFFIKKTWKKFVTATVQRENYERNTLESLADVKTKCGLLLQEAEKSNMYQMFHSTRVNMHRSAAMQATVERMSREQLRPHELRNIMLELLDESERKLILHLREQDFLYQRQIERLRVDVCLAAADRLAPTSPANPPQWPHVASLSMHQRTINPQNLLEWIGTSELLAQDMQKISERHKAGVPEREQARAEQLIRTRQFREWLTAPTSAHLLVHGNYDRRAYISGLTLFCLSLTTTLAERASRFIPVAFFCGLHTEPVSMDSHTGGRAILQSFLGQLLQRWDFGSVQMSSFRIEDYKIRQGDLNELCKLFEALVRMLPNYMVLICLIDGILYYERDEFRAEMALVLNAILRISVDSSVSVTIKVLVTSPTRTVEVRQEFPDDLILSMDAMAPAGLVASSSRLGRELQESGLR